MTKTNCEDCGRVVRMCDCMADNIVNHYNDKVRYRQAIETAIEFCHDVEHDGIKEILESALVRSDPTEKT